MANSIDLIDASVAGYIAANTTAPSPLEQRLIDETAQLTNSGMQIAPTQARFMSLLTRALRPRLAVEIGTFTGYSALVVAQALPDGATLLACDVSEEWTAIGRRYWAEAGVDDRIDLRIGPAGDTLATLPADATVDLAFIDADKTGYLGYFEQLVPLLSDRGVILVDNVLWSGRVVSGDDTSPDTVALRAFNAHVQADPRVDVALLPIGDGLSMISLAG